MSTIDGRVSAPAAALSGLRSPSAAPVEPPYPRRSYAWYVIGVLSLAYVSAFIDRQILSLLVVPIRRDLGIGDTAMSLLMGFSFAAFYTLLGFPIGRLADSRSRRTIIAVGIAAWSAMTILCGFARTYLQLLLARIGVGVGEAALNPPAFSLITDYFPRERLATALSVYSAGIYLGAGLAMIIGGAVVGLVADGGVWTWPVVGAIQPWQSVFFLIGVPGLVVALLMYTVREPLRRGVRRATGGGAGVPVRDVLAYLRANRQFFARHTAAIALLSLVANGTAAWLATFLIRTHGWSVARAGLTLGTLTLVFGVAGVVMGGRVADALSARGVTEAKLRVGMLGAAGMLVSGAWYTLAPTSTLTLIALVPLNFFVAFPYGAAAAVVQEIMPNNMRAQASAMYLFGISFVGVGLGPTAVALVTDFVFRNDGSLRYSLLIVTVLASAGSLLLLRSALPWYGRSVELLKDWESGSAS